MPGSARASGRNAPASLVGGVDGYVDVDGVRLHYVEAGAGPAVLLLHGFPEFWYTWRHQMRALANAGFRAIALDMRGYNLSSKPVGVRNYAMDRLVADVRGVAEQLAGGRVHLVGHDWGGAVAWAVAMYSSDVVESLTILNAPHPITFARALRSLDQLRRSWYIFALQLPAVPEAIIRADDFKLVRRVLRHDPVHRDAYTADDIERYLGALSQPGALTAMVNYYRAALRHRPAPPPREARVVRQPTLVVWGDRDRYLSTRLLDGLERWVPDVRIVRVPEASHWVMADTPERVSGALIDFLLGTTNRGIEDE